MRRLILTVSGLGFLLCTGLLLLSFVAPLQVERWAREAIEHEVQRKVEARWQSLEKPALVRAAERQMRAHADEIAQARRVLVALAVREMQDPDCPCRRKLREFARGALEDRIDRLANTADRLRQLAQTKYADVSAALLRELRIFSAGNAAVFALLGVVAFLRRRATLQLLAPTVVLLGAAAMVACGYLFSQNWLQTILLSDYVGWAYAPWLGLAVAAMADVVWNRARVCTMLVNGAANVLGAAACAAPC
ncbi:MAG TPA: hypothetical protein VIN58_23775 [Roseateles sp.]